MTDKFKDLKLTVGNVINIKKGNANYKEIFDKISMSEVDDIFKIIDKYSNDQKIIEREIKKYINQLV